MLARVGETSNLTSSWYRTLVIQFILNNPNLKCIYVPCDLAIPFLGIYRYPLTYA